MKATACFAWGATALLAGCAGVTPPIAALPANAAIHDPSAQGAFMGANDPRVTPDPVPLHWWHLYDSPTLDPLVQQALAANTDLREAAANLHKAQAGLDLSDADHSPTTTLGAQPGFARRSAQEELHPGKPFPDKFVYGTGFSVSYQLDLFGQIQHNIDAAQADVGAATAARDAVRITVVAETTRAYLEWCSAGREIGVAKRQVALQSQSTTLTRRLAALGRGTPVDVDRSSTQEQQVRASIPSLEAQRHVASYRLATLTGQTPRTLSTELADCDQEPRLVKPIPVGDGAGLLRRRPDIRRAEFDVMSAADRIGVTQAELYPKVTLGASVASVGLMQEGFRNDSFKFSLGPLISWEFPDRSRTHARIRAAEADREAKLARFDGVVLGALKETESALEVLSRDQERLAFLQSARTQAQNAAQEIQRQFEAGRVGYLPVLDAQRTLTQVEQGVASAETRVATDQVNLFLALGGGWEDGEPDP
jgi:NodT family efflux transporter outer membrane factor (OMF) lipoprotein